MKIIDDVNIDDVFRVTDMIFFKLNVIWKFWKYLYTPYIWSKSRYVTTQATLQLICRCRYNPLIKTCAWNGKKACLLLLLRKNIDRETFWLSLIFWVQLLYIFVICYDYCFMLLTKKKNCTMNMRTVHIKLCRILMSNY